MADALVSCHCEALAEAIYNLISRLLIILLQFEVMNCYENFAMESLKKCNIIDCHEILTNLSQ
ncbi:hypothetical protein [Helicobacter rodentium]|uniref:hypothetical protein n=1 Tax=Helicobacter rodentium TaxID=59617 RepID=UPI0023544700|nr:hypothetical protein [Helicobacter rodentium]